MSSQARIGANRRNAQKSTGPRTPEGKARSSQNALRHGLAAISHHSFLAAEDRSAFERMLGGYIRIYQPAHADEVDLLTDAVFCKWRQQRAWTTEAQMIEMAVALNQHDLQKKLPKANVAAQVANGFIHSAEQTQPLRRYEAQLHRQYLRNLKELRDLQAFRTGLEPTLDDLYPEEPSPTHAPIPNPTPNPISGSTPATSPTRPCGFRNSSPRIVDPHPEA